MKEDILEISLIILSIPVVFIILGWASVGFS
jgi:hypothetical protein